MSNIALSILTPAVPSRMRWDPVMESSPLETLCKKIDCQIGDLPVEHLVLLDNKRRTVGEKRDALLRAAQGKYISFVDDDDDVSSDYVMEILIAAKQNPDVITFRQLSSVNEFSAIVEFKLGNPHEQYRGETCSGRPPDLNNICGVDEVLLPNVRRGAAHLCAWRRSLAITSHFPAINYGEDFAFSVPLSRLAKTEVHIPRVIHHYRHSDKTTEAPPDS